MRISISTGDKRLSVKLPDDDCNRLFNTLVNDTLHSEPVAQEISQAVQRGNVHEEIVPCNLQLKQAALDKPKSNPAETCRTGYTGFLYIRCQHCGKERGFCAKLPVSESQCRDCGEKTPLKNLHKVHFTCECGRHFGYFTNITDDMFEIACKDCETPNTIFRNPKTGDYSDEKGKK